MTPVPDHGHARKLVDLGEFRVIAEVIEPTLVAAGVRGPRDSDSSWLDVAERRVVVSCDAAPKPLAWDFLENPWAAWGWYALATSLSDLAASGSTARGVVTSIEASRDMSIDDLRDFHEGLAAACTEFRVVHLGGNLREAADFACHTTVVGSAGDRVLRRSGCCEGDRLVAIGPCGEFAAAYLTARRSGLSPSAREVAYLARPRPQLREIRALLDAGVDVRAASDNSDGLLGALWNLAEASNCRILFELQAESLSARVRAAAQEASLDPVRLALTWGDWNVVASVPGGSHDAFRRSAAELQVPYAPLGRVVQGRPGIVRAAGGEDVEMTVLRNEGFAESTYRGNEEDSIAWLLKHPLDRRARTP